MPPRPMVTIPYSALDFALWVAAALVIAFGFVIAARALPKLPATIAVHFGLTGRPDSYGPRWMLVIMPVLALAIGAFMMLTARRPETFNYPFAVTPENAARMYAVGRLAIESLALWVASVLTAIEWMMIRAAFMAKARIPWVALIVIVGGTFGLIAFFLVLQSRAA